MLSSTFHLEKKNGIAYSKILFVTFQFLIGDKEDECMISVHRV